MRYEAKHRFFKHISNVVRSFQNAPKTLASRHQHYMCYQMLEPTSYLRHKTTYTGGTSTLGQNLIKKLIIMHCNCTVKQMKLNDMTHSHENLIMMAAPELSEDTCIWKSVLVPLYALYKIDYHNDVCIVLFQLNTEHAQ